MKRNKKHTVAPGPVPNSVLYGQAMRHQEFPFIEGGYGTLMLDPPWRYGNTESNGSAEDHYPTLADRDIVRLPVPELCRWNSHLYMWVTAAHLPLGLDCIKWWGFDYKQYLVWAKFKNGAPQWGTGNYWRHCTELCLFATRGGEQGLRHDLLNLFAAPREEHSAKPEILQACVETMSPGPFVELFARRARVGWSAWGNEIPRSEAVEDGHAATGADGVPSLR